MVKLLFVNACVNLPKSRTYRIAEAAVSELSKRGYDVTELRLETEDLYMLDSATLSERNSLLKGGMYEDPMFGHSRQFRDADRIVIAAPYWDHGFPTMLKCYLEDVSCPGITYRYTPEGELIGLCRAERLTYITTRGGYTSDGEDLGYATVRALCADYGIGEVDCISLAGTDIPTTDVDGEIARIVGRMSDLV